MTVLPDEQMVKVAAMQIARTARLAGTPAENEEECRATARAALRAAFASLDREALIEAGAQSAPAKRVACRRWHEHGECRNCDDRRWTAKCVLRAVGLIA